MQKDTSDKGLLPKLYRELLKINNKKTGTPPPPPKKRYKDLSRHLIKENIWMVSKNIKDALQYTSLGKHIEAERS